MAGTARAVATMGPAGHSPVAPGTAGTLTTIPIYLMVAPWVYRSLPLYAVFLLLVLALAVWAAEAAGTEWGEPDASRIVIDEAAGFVVTMTGVLPSWQTVLAGFVLFRIFDITKPAPARYFDRSVKNGFGVVMDDAAAGVYACIALHGLIAAGIVG